MKLSLYDGGWQGLALRESGSSNTLMLQVEDAAASYFQVRVRSHLLRRLGRPDDIHELTEPVVRFVLARIEALGRERVDELLASDTRYPTYLIEVADSDVEDIQSAGGKQCRYQLHRDGDLFCSAADGPKNSNAGRRHATCARSARCRIPELRARCAGAAFRLDRIPREGRWRGSPQEEVERLKREISVERLAEAAAPRSSSRRSRSRRPRTTRGPDGGRCFPSQLAFRYGQT